ncbi:hypothetical protein C7H84_35920 [Burkholderia sp. Nafp2/4-1b]|nr:hypothetical protein C7H84_35920 [Burkholderia sp. Nafp2/4-1b]
MRRDYNEMRPHMALTPSEFARRYSLRPKGHENAAKPALGTLFATMFPEAIHLFQRRPRDLRQVRATFKQTRSVNRGGRVPPDAGLPALAASIRELTARQVQVAQRE